MQLPHVPRTQRRPSALYCLRQKLFYDAPALLGYMYYVDQEDPRFIWYLNVFTDVKKGFEAAHFDSAIEPFVQEN